MGTSNERTRITDNAGLKTVTVATKGTTDSLAVHMIDSAGDQIEKFDDSDLASITTDDVDGNIEYIGLTLPENQSNTNQPVWKIIKMTYTANENPIAKFADGESTLSKIWDNRTSYSY